MIIFKIVLFTSKSEKKGGDSYHKTGIEKAKISATFQY